MRAEHVISIRKYNKTKVQIRRRGRSDNDLFPQRRPPRVLMNRINEIDIFVENCV